MVTTREEDDMTTTSLTFHIARARFERGRLITRRGFLIVAMALSILAAAQMEAATTSRLEGRVVDDQGAPLAGVQVTITSESLIGGPATTSSDLEGRFAFHLLSVGDYTVETTLVGYVPAAATASVRLDRTAAVTLRMTATSFSGEIEVGADVPIVDVTRSNTGEVFSEQYLQGATIGSRGRSYYRIMDQVAGVVVPARVFGATESENVHIVDGFNTIDPTSGASATHFVYDAIDEASVLTGGIGAEFGYGTGGVMNVVTKSGGNSFSGTVDARYRDQGFNESGEHFDPDEHPSSSRIVSATLGGPILRDRLWFFAAFENQRLENTPVGAPETTVEDGNYFLGKLTWSINPSNRLALKYSATPTTVDYLGVAYDRAPEATRLLKTSEPTAQLEFNSMLSDALLLTVGLGFSREYLDASPMVNDLETPTEWDMDSDYWFSNPPGVEFSDRDRDHHHAKLSWFVDEALGSHQLDVGMEYNKLRSEEAAFIPGGYGLVYLNNGFQDPPFPDSDGDGLVDFVVRRNVPAESARDPISSKGDGWGLFVQDEWRPIPQLTARVGVRYDTMAHTNTVGETVADFEKWLPRLGLAWDLGGNGRHVVRASWGRYMHPGATNLSTQVPGISRGFEEYLGLDFLCGQAGICDRQTAAAVFGPEFVHVDSEGNEHYFYLSGVLAGMPAETVDTLGVGRLQVPYRDELILAYEARIANETSLELTYVNKDYSDQIEDTCNNNTWAWGDGEAPSIDDSSTWTDEAACTGSVRTNLSGLARDYEAIILRAASRARPWFHLVGSYTYSKTQGNNTSQPWTGFATGFGMNFPGSAFDYFPTNFVNLDGNLEEDLRHVVKVNGYLDFPLDFALGIGAYYRSAPPLNVIHVVSQDGLPDKRRARRARAPRNRLRSDAAVLPEPELGHSLARTQGQPPGRGRVAARPAALERLPHRQHPARGHRECLQRLLAGGARGIHRGSVPPTRLG